MRTFENGLRFLGYPTWLDEKDMAMGTNLQVGLKISINDCHCFIAWLNADYFKSDSCTAELLEAKRLGKIILPFGAYSDIKKHMDGDFQFLRDILVCDPEAMSFFEILRRIDETLFNFEEKLASA